MTERVISRRRFRVQHGQRCNGKGNRMTDEARRSEEAVSDIPWVRARLDDFSGLDFESPIKASKTADSSELSDLFRQAMQLHDESSSENRAFAMLVAITGMYFKPDDR